MAAKKDIPVEQGPGKVQRFRLCIDALNKKVGDGTSASADSLPQTRRIPTGSLRLDYGTGGGFPIGRTSLVWGGESSGKTTLILRLIAEAQKLCANCYRKPSRAHVYTLDDKSTVVAVSSEGGPLVDIETGKELDKSRIEKKHDGHIRYCPCYKQGLFVPGRLPGEGDKEFESDSSFESRLAVYKFNSYEDVIATYVNIEGDLDVGWAKQLGVDLSRLFVVECASGEEAVDVVQALMESCDSDLIAVDSLAMMVPSDEVEDSANDAHVGLQARVLNRAMRVWTQARVNAKRKHKKDITLLLVNQWRMKIDKFGGGPQLVGGLGQRFVGSLQLKLWGKKGEIASIDVGKKGAEIDYAKTAVTCFKVEKNKTFGSKDTEGEIEFIVRDCELGSAGEVHEFDDMWRLAKHFKLVDRGEKAAKWVVLGRGFGTETEAKAWVHGDNDVRASMRAEVVRLMMQRIQDEGR